MHHKHTVWLCFFFFLIYLLSFHLACVCLWVWGKTGETTNKTALYSRSRQIAKIKIKKETLIHSLSLGLPYVLLQFVPHLIFRTIFFCSVVFLYLPRRSLCSLGVGQLPEEERDPGSISLTPNED